jgi:hypothetical protein
MEPCTIPDPPSNFNNADYANKDILHGVMGVSVAFVFAYLLGGITFLPAAILLILLHAHLTFPHHDPTAPFTVLDTLHEPGDDDKHIKSGTNALAQKFQRGHEPDVAEGYFAVCREYVPGGVNGKPPERTTPAGEIIGEESPSVYQSMYRSIFDRKQAPSLDASKTNGKNAKRARNVFYVVLRHGHLMLYDDSEQIEVRHVISLAHHDVSIYNGGYEIPEGELWIKRNAIRLTRKVNVGDVTATSKPFFLFSENCSDKEDFYFALLQNQERISDDPMSPPETQHFEVKDMISLVQRLHSSEEHLQTRWVNAFIGRLFLAVYKTQDIEQFVRLKIIKKIARVKKPNFLSGIVLRKVYLGESAPFITNPRLKDLTVDGHCCVEADMKYDGGFRIEIAATGRLDLGTRFKAREVNLILAVVVKKLEGHVLIKFKPPPSNRLWVAFDTMPHMEMSIEPIVSSRQITYGIILRAIESRIREVLAETVVLPHWDDSPFASSLRQRFRGGIWADDQTDSGSAGHDVPVPDEVPEDDTEADFGRADNHKPPHSTDDRSRSMPALVDTSAPKLVARKGHKASNSWTDTAEMGISSGLQKRAELPKAIRSQSFASAADPVLVKDNVDAGKGDGKTKMSKDAASAMIEISNRSHPNSPHETPVGSFNSKPPSFFESSKPGSFSSTSSKNDSLSSQSGSRATVTNITEFSIPPSPTSTSNMSIQSNPESGIPPATSKLQSLSRSLVPSSEKRQALPAIGAAAAAAKKWGWNAINRSTSPANNGSPHLPDRAGTPSQPMGRGRPLPPPGQPLPRPDKTRGILPLNISKRKPLPPPLLPDRRIDETKKRAVSTPPIPPRRSTMPPSIDQSDDQEVLVVEAPPDSEPNSPIDDGYGDFMDNVRMDEEENEEAADGGPIIAKHNEDPFHEEPEAQPRTSTDRASNIYDEDEHGLSSWKSAQEEEARLKSAWMDEKEHP